MKPAVAKAPGWAPTLSDDASSLPRRRVRRSPPGEGGSAEREDGREGGRTRSADFLALTKPRLNLLVLFTTLAGLYLTAPGGVPILILAHTLIGTALVAGGSAALNQVWERDTDGLMRRTRTRPLPDGRLRPAESLGFGLALSALGLLELAFGVNVVAAGVAALTLASYILLYTPLKRRTWLSTLIGAFPGALPPVIGCAAATGTVSVTAVVLFGIVFLWQMPHFLAIAWLYREDYARAGLPLLPVIEPDGRSTGRQALLYALALLPMSIAPAAVGLAGAPYVAVALVLGITLVVLSARFARALTTTAARQLFVASIVYLPVLWGALVANRLWQ